MHRDPFEIREKLKGIGIKNTHHVFYNLSRAELYEETTKRGEAKISYAGPLVVDTRPYTGRSPQDKFIVKEPTSENTIDWGKVNIPFETNKFDALYSKVTQYLEGKDAFVQDLYVCADPSYRMNIRVITDRAWQSLFAQNMFITINKKEELRNYTPDFTIISCNGFEAAPTRDGTRSKAFVIINFAKKIILIGGTCYAGEIKKSVFTILNYLLPLKGVFTMHSSANVGKTGDTAVFFGLSGTGKTSLSADPQRGLIGDDEHGWGENGVFNFEGGCYAKMIKLSKEREPDIYECAHMFGTVLENVVMNDETRIVNLDDNSYTENTRGAYPISFNKNIIPEERGGHAQNIIMLTCDAFGVLPPISKLTPAQAVEHFLLGYTAKIAGTERDMKSDVEMTFSTCFGAPFMVHKPTKYGHMLKEKIEKHKAQCWLVNTGWTGGPYGEGERIHIKYTRKMIDAALSGELSDATFKTDPIFGLSYPVTCDGVPPELLNPIDTWKDKNKFNQTAQQLEREFKKRTASL